ncbi:hypothetical protein ACTHGU_10645 [Chitinophagaceae bacterium MMS25-I14]
MVIACRIILLLLVVLTHGLPCMARFEFSGGPLLTYPVIITSAGTMLNSGHLGAGIRFGVDYNPDRGRFFPSLRLSYGQNRLPLQTDGVNQGALNFSVYSLMLNGAYAGALHERQLVFYSGLGVFNLNRRKTAPSGTENTIVSVDSSANITHFFPAADAGIEYRGITAGKRFYLTAGMCVNYVWLPDGFNTYNLEISHDNKIVSTPANFSGHLLIPTIYLAVTYKPKKQKNNWYLE